jgi:peptidyl-prolyl cis-trans isomerase A (cyclophilin A)
MHRVIQAARAVALASLLAAPGAQAQTAASPAAGAAPQATIRTSMGPIVVELYPDKAPRSVDNFMQYARDGFFDGTVFHRVIPGFMIQGGGFTRDMRQKPTRPPIPIESKNGLRNDAGTLAMARTSDPNSATSQFFINVVDNPNLNYPSFDGHGYAVFGRVVRGMDVVDKIKSVRTSTQGPHQNVPAEPVVIESVTLDKASK